jgi:hypothetical protein
MRWWETFGRRMHLPPHQFGVHYITRTTAISYAGLHRRHAGRIQDAETEFARAATAATDQDAAGGSALDLPATVGPLRLGNRVAVRANPLRFAATGVGLVIADTRDQRIDGGEWRAAAERLAESGTVVGVTVDQLDRALMHRIGVRLVEVMLTEAAVLDSLDSPDDGIAVCAGLACPPVTPWSRVGDRLVDRCRSMYGAGVAGLRLHAPDDPAIEWDHVLRWADRIRTETGLPVLVDGPPGWVVTQRGVERVADVPKDDVPTRLHIALVSGRADVVVADAVVRPVPSLG